MDLIRALVSGPEFFTGEGINHEGERFIGQLQVQPLVEGTAVLLSYIAKLPDGSVVHEEASLVGRQQDGTLCLWPVMSELPAVCPHKQKSQSSGEQTETVVFAFGERDERDSFREEISISVSQTGTLTYAHAWGLPGGEFADRSSCLLLASEA
jgi:hypothetical protein